MLLVFNAGPECLDAYTIQKMADGLQEPTNLTLCFAVPFTGRDQNDRMKALIKIRDNLETVLRNHGFPIYRALYQPISTEPIAGRLGAWVKLARAKTRKDHIVHQPIVTNRSRPS